MDEDQDKCDVREYLVPLLHRLTGLPGKHSGKRSCLLVTTIDYEAGDDGSGQEYQQQYHHIAAAGAVAEMACATAKQNQIAHIAKHGGRRVEEIGEEGMRRTNKAPKDAGHNEHTDRIACPDMNGQRVVFGEIGDGKCRDEDPVENPYEEIPYINIALRGYGIESGQLAPINTCFGTALMLAG